jgi:hypothetical protein
MDTAGVGEPEELSSFSRFLAGDLAMGFHPTYAGLHASVRLKPRGQREASFGDAG